MRHALRDAALAAGIGALVMACSPTIRVQAPDRPIEINLTVKIQQDVRVRVERADGLVGAVSTAADVAQLVQSINDARMDDYRKIAAQQGTKVDAVQAIAGAKQVEKARANGWYFMDASGSWKKNK